MQPEGSVDTAASRPPHPAPRSTWRRRIGWTALAGIVALCWGVGTARAEHLFGPHEAVTHVTTDGRVTVDLGPLGTVQRNSPAPVLGARVTVREIPLDVDILDQSRTLDALAGDLEQYVQFFTSPQVTVQATARALVVDAAGRTLVAWVVIVGAALGARALLGARRRAELVVLLRPRRFALRTGTVLAVVVLVTLPAAVPLPVGPQPIEGAEVFRGTALEGTRVTGRLAGVIDTYGSLIVDAYEDNERFYAGVVEDLDRQWQARAELEEELSEYALVQRGLRPVGDEDDLLTIVLMSDLHCNVGMAPVVGRLVELSGAALLLNGGDTTINSTEVESWCVDTLAGAIPSGIPIVVADGNHDGPVTAAQERAAGMTALEGEVVEVEGLRILGDVDPYETRIATGTSQAGPETLEERASALADVACADEDGVDLLLVHNPRMGEPTLERGCAPVQLSGHMHARIGPRPSGQGMSYVSSSTGGATYAQPTLGPLRSRAEITVVTVDRGRELVVGYRVVGVERTGAVDVGRARPFPRPWTGPSQDG